MKMRLTPPDKEIMEILAAHKGGHITVTEASQMLKTKVGLPASSREKEHQALCN